MNFSTKQLQAIESGKIRRNSLIKAAQKVSQIDLKRKNVHSYIYSLGGLGKTHNVTKALKQLNVPHEIVSGKTTDFGFALQIAILVHKKPKGIPFRVVVDDCDAILNQKFINTLKNMLEGDKTLKYTSAILPHLLDTPAKEEAIKAFKKDVGFEVPCDELIFIFTSNTKLPNSNEALAVESSGASGGKAQRIKDLNAIRTRCVTKDIIFANEQEHWGWIADVVLNDKGLDHHINREKQIELLNWLWNNWAKLSGRDLRTVDQMAEIMKYEEDEYLDTWESDYIDHTYLKNNKNLNYAGL